MQSSLLLRYGNEHIAKGYIQSRIAIHNNDYKGGINIGGSVIFEDKLCSYILERNKIIMNSE